MKMKGYLYVILAALALLATSCVNDNLAMGESGEEKPFVEGELLVKFTPEVADIIAEAGIATRGGVTRSSVPSVDEVLEIVGAYHLERLFPVDERTEERTHESGLDRWYIVRFGGDYSAEQRRHFTEKELRDLLHSTATPIDSYMTRSLRHLSEPTWA